LATTWKTLNFMEIQWIIIKFPQMTMTPSLNYSKNLGLMMEPDPTH